MLWTPERQAQSAWTEHVPFVFWLVDVLRPRTIVELGTHNGVSYSAMCQAVKSLGLSSSCFAVDTWKGDEHAGFYAEDVYKDFAAFHDQRYSAFSRLVRSSFDEALHHFEDGSIDLLHIDGLHTYEAARHDYRSWLPKLAANAVVLFHDTNVRERGFGVFRLWSELAAESPHFNFLHGHGLGVLGQGRNYSGALRILFDARDDCVASSIREIFAKLGRSVRALSEMPSLDLERNGEIDALRKALAAREEELASLRRGVAEREVRILALDQTVSGRTAETAALRDALAELRQGVVDRDAKIKSLEITISALYGSSSWRITAPVRRLRRISSLLRHNMSNRAVAALWRALKTPSLAPLHERRGIHAVPSEPGARYLAERDVEYIPLAEPGPISSAVRCIAFYLPQFHPIPENDQSWGPGFTEWTNVSKARPAFAGHYQPHLPGELGFYDLRLPQVQRRQAELAKQYGIHGFCYYFYWFGGRILLDLPLRNMLKDQDIDFPFCLCWANENWTRQWDGRDDDVLIAQSHSPVDDLLFIEHIAPILRDRRYITVGDRPLLIVYGPMLLPDPSATAARWRDHCRKAGIGEIFLVSTHAFDGTDPRQIGFDAAIELAPNKITTRDIASGLTLFNSGFSGNVFDYRAFVERSYQTRPPEYCLFRSVCPSWDNSARKRERGTIFVHSSPAAYQEWLENVSDYTIRNFADESRLVFINAWNEWAESAYLEPDRRYGYAFLNATAKALQSVELRARRVVPQVGVIVHVFYEDIWPEIAAYLRAWKINFQLYATVPEHRAQEIGEVIQDEWPGAVVTPVQNRGRDIAPFLLQAKQAVSDGMELLCKIHTKRSPHRTDGNLWRSDLFRKILGGTSSVEQVIDAFSQNAALGILAPEDHLLPDATHWGSNVHCTLKLAAKMGYEGDPTPFMFAAGSMFWIRAEAMLPIFKLGLTAADFEEEAGQVDGTLAHAMERLFPIAAKLKGLRIADTRILSKTGLRSDAELAVSKMSEQGFFSR